MFFTEKYYGANLNCYSSDTFNEYLSDINQPKWQDIDKISFGGHWRLRASDVEDCLLQVFSTLPEHKQWGLIVRGADNTL